MDAFVRQLRAAAEPSRLRILGLCARHDLTVSDLTGILDQSQPRVSRHIRLLVEAGLLNRWQEGARAHCQIADTGPAAGLARLLVERLPQNDPTLDRDRERLRALLDVRAARATAFFRDRAAEWDRLRAAGLDQPAIADALARALPPGGSLLDIGTGTGWVLTRFAPDRTRAVGIDNSPEMLAVARSNLARANLDNCRLQLGDMYSLPWDRGSFGAATMHMVLHYAERPAAAIAEAARVLTTGGRLLIVDYGPHDRPEWRRAHGHQWPGFPSHQIGNWLCAAGLVPRPARRIESGASPAWLWAGDAPARPPVADPPRTDLPRTGTPQADPCR